MTNTERGITLAFEDLKKPVLDHGLEGLTETGFGILTTLIEVMDYVDTCVSDAFPMSDSDKTRTVEKFRGVSF